MLKRTRSFLVLSLAVATIAPLLLSTPSSAQTPPKRVYLEEFTGAWCGFCVRGAYSIDNLYQTYPGQVVVISIHNDQSNKLNDMMDIPQGDSLVSDVGFPAAEALQGFPDGWTARSITSGSTTWNIDPSAWATGVGAQFGISESDGVVADLLSQPVQATVTVDSISFNNATQQGSARVSVTFATAVSGDLRLNLMITEDSVTGSGPGWDQHNYYSSTGSVGPSVPNNPMYNYPPSIPGWEHMHVFREAVGGVHGVAGIIPSNVSAGETYSKKFTFKLPSNIQNPTQVHLIGIVHEYSATDASANQVLDADEVPLPTLPYDYTNVLVTPTSRYSTAKSNNATPQNILLTNNGPSSVTLALSIDPSAALPQGWSAAFVSDTITVAAGGTENASLNITAPGQSAFVAIPIWVKPVKDGYFALPYQDTVYYLSDNTRCPLFYDPNAAIPTPDALLDAAIPDSLKQFTAEVPLSDGTVAAYPPESFPISIFDNIMLLDNGGDEAVLNDPTIVGNVTNALAAGAKVFISSDYALGYAFDQTSSYFSQFSGLTETPDVQNFYAQIGLNFTTTTVRFNPSTGAVLPFAIKGETNDPVGNNISETDKGGYFSCIYSIDSASTASFYSDGKTKNIIGSTYIDPSSNGRLVYLGFGLSELTNTTLAKTIATNSINWLLASAPAAVNASPIAPIAGMTASPNPFHGMTQVQYVAGQDEHGVSLAAYDLLGREVAKLATQSNGGNTYTALFDGSKLANGTYVIIAHSTTGTHEVRVVNQQ